MADEQYRWLNGETAELLLRGESVKAVESVDTSARDQAERLAGALGALSVPDTAAEGELPGEAAAVAAFRKAAEARTGDADAGSVTSRDPSGDVGLVRIGRPGRPADGPARFRLRRPVRLGIAAALLLGSAGGAAALAVTGVIPGFDDSEPGPAATVSAAVTPDRTTGSASPDGTATGGPGSTRTGGATGGFGHGTARDGSSGGPSPGVTGQPGDGTIGWKGVTAACRDLRNGRNLGVGRTRALEAAAGGASRVATYCRSVLQSAGGSSGSSNGQGGGNANGGGNGNADGGGQGNGNGGGNGNGNGGGQGDKGNHNGGGGDDNGPIREGHGVRHRDVTAVTPSPAAFAPPASPSAQAPAAPEGTPGTTLPAPDPTYSAL